MNIETKKSFSLIDVIELIHCTDGVVIQDDPKNNIYPMPITAHEKNEVFVGRIRRDNSIENGLDMWVVADNLRKGAATNAVQIASYIIENKLI